MEKLSPAYLSAMAEQLGSLSAFLGGFAATFLATLLSLGHQGRLMTASVALASISSVAFIVAVVAASMLGAMFHPQAPAILSTSSALTPRVIMSLAFGVGIYALLFAIACSGWMRSRTTGWTTTAVSAIGVLLITLLTVHIG